MALELFYLKASDTPSVKWGCYEDLGFLEMPVLDAQFPSDSLTPLGSITNIIKLDWKFFKYEKHL